MQLYKAYRLESDKELDIVNNSWLYDIDEDFLIKQDYITRAETLTARINKEFNTNYKWYELFGKPKFIGWCYDKDTKQFDWYENFVEKYDN